MSIMPTLKTEILGSIIEINYQEAEKEKLERLISRLTERINEFNHNAGQISDSKIKKNPVDKVLRTKRFQKSAPSHSLFILKAYL